METTKIKIPLLSETEDCIISCTHAKSWPPPHMVMAARFPGQNLDDIDAQWSDGNLKPTEYQRIQVWKAKCGQLKMGSPCFSCDLAKLESAPGQKLKGAVSLKVLLQKENQKAGLPYNHSLGFLADGPPEEVAENIEDIVEVPVPEVAPELVKKAAKKTTKKKAAKKTTRKKAAKKTTRKKAPKEPKPVPEAEAETEAEDTPKKVIDYKELIKAPPRAKAKSEASEQPEAPKVEEPEAPKVDADTELEGLLGDLGE